jgi:hypothetical protein
MPLVMPPGTGSLQSRGSRRPHSNGLEAWPPEADQNTSNETHNEAVERNARCQKEHRQESATTTHIYCTGISGSDEFAMAQHGK